MTEHEILRAYESGAVDDWELVGILTELGDGQYSLLIEQVPQLECSESHFLDRFSTGEEMVEFVCGAWWWGQFEYWQQITEGIAKVDQTLALAVIEALQEPEEPVPSAEEQWAARATWERRKFRGGGAQWASIGEGIRGRHAILQYVLSHDGLPTGVHHVCVDCPPLPWLSQPGRFEADVTFPAPSDNVERNTL